MKYVVLVKLRAPGGVAVYYPQATTTAPIYPLPSPTTLLGALAYPYLRKNSGIEAVNIGGKLYSPAVKILEKVSYVAAGSEGYLPSREVERVHQVIYMRKQHWEKLDLYYSIGVRGNAHYLDDNLYLLYIVDDKGLADYAYGIVRVGRKEGLVVVDEVIVEEVNKTVKSIGKGIFRTLFYFPTKIAICPEGNALRMPMPILIKENFSEEALAPVTEEYCIPRLGEVVSELKSPGALISVGGYNIPVPKEVVS